MKTEEQNVELKILKAAENLFLKQGFMRTTTAQIAKEAGCNQAMVHYYYRKKERLFEKIYSEKIQLMMSNLLTASSSTATFEERIMNIVGIHFDFLKQNPLIPAFLLNEAFSHSSDRRTHLMDVIKKHSQTITAPLENELSKRIKDGTIRPISSFDLILTILSLNIGAFLIGPVFQKIWEISDERYQELIEHRKEEVIQTIFARLKK